jgi:hypothetical protein
VSKFALITVKHALYSVPSRLIGHRLKVRVFDAHIEAYLGEHCVLNAQRPRSVGWGMTPREGDRLSAPVACTQAQARRAGALAFARCAVSAQRICRHLAALARATPEKAAARTMIGLLDLAASHGCEALLAQRLAELIERNELPELARTEPRVCSPRGDLTQRRRELAHAC